MVRVTDSRRNSSLNKHSTVSGSESKGRAFSATLHLHSCRLWLRVLHTFSLITMTMESPVVPVSGSSLRPAIMRLINLKSWQMFHQLFVLQLLLDKLALNAVLPSN